MTYMNWYRVLRPFDNHLLNSLIMLEPNVRSLDLEFQGYMVYVGPVMQEEEPEPEKPKRGRRGKQVEAGPVQSEDAGDSVGDGPRTADVSGD